jgi:hypothetical protein
LPVGNGRAGPAAAAGLLEVPANTRQKLQKFRLLTFASRAAVLTQRPGTSPSMDNHFLNRSFAPD